MVFKKYSDIKLGPKIFSIIKALMELRTQKVLKITQDVYQNLPSKLKFSFRILHFSSNS